MHGDPATVVQTAVSLIRAGRFSEAVATLEYPSTRGGPRQTPMLALPLLADALQRTGNNDRAETIASSALNSGSRNPEVSARYHFVLGNVHRERGDLAKAIEHLQISGTFSSPDLELACWAQLRLMTTVAELRGIQVALGRLDGVRRTLARCGDARPFAALHLWLAEMESTRGYSVNARRHLARAASLLLQVDDVWLQGYLAINSSAVSYHCAETEEARRWADRAITYADASGHRGTRRAANANLGQIEFSRGNLSKAEEHFHAALACCEEGTVTQIAVLDSIAQSRLHGGDFEGCELILKRLENLTTRGDDTKSRYYQTWALQTKIQLLLKTGKVAQAKELTRGVRARSDEVPQPRVSTVSYLVAAETLIATGDTASAANMLAAVLSPGIQLPPDLFAQMERVAANAVRLGGADSLAAIHLNRAIQTFDAIGHHTGQSTASLELVGLTNPATVGALGMKRALDRVRAMMDLRSRPELLGREALSFLQELNCAEEIVLEMNNVSTPSTVSSSLEELTSSTKIQIQLNRTESTNVALAFRARQDPCSIITTLEFRRVIEQIVAIDPPDLPFGDFDLSWAANDWSSTEGVVFTAESMLEILNTVKKVAQTDISVLITGETGVGKEIIARRIHEQSLRTAMPFVALNCAAVPKELLESQLFGYRRGAFSGATESFQGVVRAANGGTLFLDEIAELSLEAQAKLLRFLELGEVHPIGEALPCKVNVRILFATNDDLQSAVRERRFREDLFYRLNVVSVRVPPLRERREEIPFLVNLFTTRFAREFSKEAPQFTNSAMEMLILYSWPGNVRQLSNEIRRITALVPPAGHVTPDQLSPEIAIHARESAATLPGSPQITLTLDQTLEQATDRLEREMIQHALKGAQGRVAEAAVTLGLSRKGLYLKRRRLKLFD